MKKLAILILLVVPYLSSAQQLPEKDPKNENIFIRTEEMPEFPGGPDAMYKYLSANLKYPESAFEQGIQGKVYLSFIVTTKGEIKEVEVIRGVQSDLDKEAIRVVKSMPVWIPGKQDGVPVTVKFTLPIYFNLN